MTTKIPTEIEIRELLEWTFDKAHYGGGATHAIDSAIKCFYPTLFQFEPHEDPQLLGSGQVWQLLDNAMEELLPKIWTREELDKRHELILRHLQTVFWKDLGDMNAPQTKD